MKKIIKWDKGGAYQFLALAQHSETDDILVIYKGYTGGLVATPIQVEKPEKFAKDMPKNKRFNLA